MQFLRQWLLSVTACALLVSVSEQLTPSGALRPLVRFTGGLVLILCILQPVTQIDLEDVTFDLGAYEEAVASVKLELSDGYDAALSGGIAERTGAYIEDKAASLGIIVRASVRTEMVEGTVLPTAVTLYGEQSAALSDWIAGELGIAKEKQVWTEAG